MELGKRTNRGLGAIKTGPIGCCILDHVVTLCSFLRRLTGELEKDPGRSKGVRRGRYLGKYASPTVRSKQRGSSTVAERKLEDGK